jgi:hypothetical protein
MAAIRKTVIPYVFARWDTSGKRGRGKWGPGRLWVLFLAIAAIVRSHQTAAAPTKEVRRILILNEVNSSYPAIPLINQRIQAGVLFRVFGFRVVPRPGRPAGIPRFLPSQIS